MKRKISLVVSILAGVTFIASADQWAGWPAEGGDVVLPDGEKVFVSDADIDNFSKATSIIFGENSELVITNMAQTFFDIAAFQGNVMEPQTGQNCIGHIIRSFTFFRFQQSYEYILPPRCAIVNISIF